MKRLLRHLPLLQYLENLSPAEQKKIVGSSGNQDFLKLFNELALNIVEKNIILNSSQIRNLRRFETEIKKLSERQHSFKTRKEILTKGSFLKILISELMPSLIELVLKKNEMMNHSDDDEADVHD